MILLNAAAHYTRVAQSQTATAIAAGETIKVHGIVATSVNGNGTVTVLDANSNVIMTINVVALSTTEIKTGWIADKGLRITTDSQMVCTVFHSNASA